GEIVSEEPINIKLGPGLIQVEESIVATSCGILKKNKNKHQYWLEFNSKRYIPSTGDSVLGVVTKKLGEGYVIDIGSAQRCNLSGNAFEGATKKTRPNLKVGTLLYGKIVLAHKDMEPEMECYNSFTNKAEGFGELKDGFAFNCSIGLCRRLLNPKNKLLNLIGNTIPFEICIGLNGCIWINTEKEETSIGLKNILLEAEDIEDDDED
ncbi:exosome complex exonuclease RRP40, partial [Neoconidiobolus thromboides FSU 785]